MVLGDLGSKLNATVRKILQRGAADKALIKEIRAEIFLALIEADVNYDVAAEIVDVVEQSALDTKLPPGLSRRKSIVAALNNELVRIMGKGGKLTMIPGRPTVLMMVGIQGSGKTTTTAKLANHLRKRGHKIGVVCADTWRPGAYDQLSQLSDKIGVLVFGEPESKNAVKIAKNGIKHFIKEKTDYIIVDTAGRHKQEKDLLKEMKDLGRRIQPDEIILVIDGTLGQQAFPQAEAFAKATTVGSIIVTKLDGGAKGGGAISAAAATSVPIKFIGEGETPKDLAAFHPVRFVSRLLGMGDLESLLDEVRQAEAMPSEQQARDMLLGKFTLRDMMQMLEQVNKMGSIRKLMSMLPGGLSYSLPDDAMDSSKESMAKFKAIMDSMTEDELDGETNINRSRIDRISRGSGTTVADVKMLLAQYKNSKKLMKGMRKGRRGGMQIPGMPGFGQ